MNVLTATKEVIDKRKANKLYPHTADVIEVRRVSGLTPKEFNKQARTLLDNNKIKLIRTINGFAIDVI